MSEHDCGSNSLTGRVGVCCWYVLTFNHQALIERPAEFAGLKDQAMEKAKFGEVASKYPTVVGVLVDIKEVRSIDPISGKFEATFMLMAWWHDPELEEDKGLNVITKSNNAPALRLMNLDEVIDGSGQLDESGDIGMSESSILRREGLDSPAGLM